MAPHTPLVIRTLGDFPAHTGHTLSAHCPACQHSEPVDVRRLVARYGGDIEPREPAPLLRCRECDHKGGEIIRARALADKRALAQPVCRDPRS